MSDEHNKGGFFKHVAPHWVAAGVAALSLLAGLVMTVRADDLSSITRKIDANQTNISSLERQMAQLATQEAVLLQRENDMLDLLNRYMQGQAPK